MQGWSCEVTEVKLNFVTSEQMGFHSVGNLGDLFWLHTPMQAI